MSYTGVGPNPFKESIHIRKKAKFQLHVYTITGVKVYSGKHFDQAEIGSK